MTFRRCFLTSNESSEDYLQLLKPRAPLQFSKRDVDTPSQRLRLTLNLDRIKELHYPQPEYPTPPTTPRLDYAKRRMELKTSFAIMRNQFADFVRPEDLETSSIPSTPSERYRLLKDQARAAFQLGDYPKAIEYVSHVIALHPTYFLLCFRSRLYILLDDYNSSLADAENAVLLQPSNPVAYVCKGNALSALERFVEAAMAYETALEQCPYDSSALAGHDTALFKVKYERYFFLTREDYRRTLGRYCKPKLPDLGDPLPVVRKAVKEAEGPKRKAIDEQWTTIDVGDMMGDQDKLRDVIDDISRASRLEKQHFADLNKFLKRNGLPKQVTDKVSELYIRGSMTDEDRELLQALRPPKEAQAEWNDIMQLMSHYAGPLMVIFRHYALSGRGGGKLDIITLNQFLIFAKDMNLLLAGTNITKSLVERVFIRANWEPQQKSSGKEAGGSTKELELHEFVNAVLRLSFWRYPLVAGMAARFKKFVEEHILLSPVLMAEDHITHALSSKELKTVLEHQRDFLQRLFVRYATMNQAMAKRNRRAENASIDFGEYEYMLKELSLYNDGFTTREARRIFVHVNVDDDLYEQADKNNNSSVLVYDEFEEVMVRIAAESAVDLNKAEMTSQQLADLFNRFVEGTLKKAWVSKVK
eukprot:TRINITY_DN8746_c0_g1::TRINITY_DN8746_c0_g1_i1::g.23929::m.23929 TRINITY_DN8746_c0_g1::TRINITY_DN8746_c0_g1_i1::g.23929  ORF type:complete len:644 (-),score=196.67,sp/Q9NES8/PPP5_CAEEL/31.15/1e-08,TPR_2/PF07719.12/0.0027,TPR_2/PF07719.12/1.8,TPR_2/PF07719.12/0.093,TPR_11/PF13414.1/4.8e-06,TPR_11/PF13414.1/7.6e-05,TPR_1/PF00515.23/0.012,TPR_1/PF00515.23/58,TPR_1/PF00515.23/0.0013,TPR_9/PF13371.1/0.3,TPR_9/PF13371.1/0.00044,TPR_9/PF13371.1/5e+03,TPR_14/PF13428.1/0.87,TPR_14/PF13428.1/1.3e+03,TPR_14